MTEDYLNAVRWIEDFAAQYGFTYSMMLEAALEYLESGHYLRGGPELEGEWIPPEFWEKYEIITGKKVEDDDRGNFFSCAC